MKKRRFTAAVLALGISFSLIFQIPVSAAQEDANTQESADAQAATGEGGSSPISTNSIAGWPQGPEITSTAAVVMEDSTNTVLYGKNMDTPLYPASAVKIMTILLALENSNAEDQVVMTATGVSGVTDGGANISAQLDESFSMEQCMYAIMVASANDIALQVAEHIGGSVEAFVQMMNTRAQELGCTNTVFTNPTGLPDENQHTTAHDMALIMKAAMSNETFRSMAKTTSYTIPATNMSGGERVLTNRFSMIDPASDAYYEGCLGGKEGFTEASGSTLVCAAERNGMTLISVVLQGASGQTDDEAITTLDYGFSNFQKLSLGEDDFGLVSGGTVIVPVGTSEDGLTVEDNETDGQIERQYLFGGAPVGTAVLENVQEQDNTVTINGEANMKAAKDFSASRTNMPYYLIGGAGVVLFLLLLFAMVKVVKS